MAFEHVRGDSFVSGIAECTLETARTTLHLFISPKSIVHLAMTRFQHSGPTQLKYGAQSDWDFQPPNWHGPNLQMIRKNLWSLAPCCFAGRRGGHFPLQIDHVTRSFDNNKLIHKDESCWRIRVRYIYGGTTYHVGCRSIQCEGSCIPRRL